MACGERLKLVLVIEDDAETRECLRCTLQQNRRIIAAVADGADALAFLKHDRPDAIVVDFNLPSLRGHNLQRDLEAHADDGVPVIVVAECEEVLPPAEFACILRKPIHHDMLCAAVEHVLGLQPIGRLSLVHRPNFRNAGLSS